MLFKGRSNYISLRRMETAQARSASLFHDEAEFTQLREIIQWSKRTTDGSLSDLPVRPLGQVWDEVASDSGNCMGRRCPTYNKCFYYAARRRAQNAHILVVNHALFFSDLGLRRSGVSILPDYDIVIFDEAHTIEAVAGDHLGLGVTSSQIDFALTRLYNDRTNRGLLVHYKMKEAEQEVDRCRHRAEEFFESIEQWLAARPNSNGRVRVAGDRAEPAHAFAEKARPDAQGQGRHAPRREGAARFQLGLRAVALARRRDRAVAHAIAARFSLLDRADDVAPRAAADRAGRRADRRRPAVARTALRRDADRRAHQRDALDRQDAVVRFFQVADRTDESRRACGWAARSITSGKPS